MPTQCPQCGDYHHPHDVVYYGMEEACRRARTGPAPKEEKMETWHNCTSRGCDELSWGTGPKRCDKCNSERAATLRAVYDRAFDAAMAGAAIGSEWNPETDVGNAEAVALESVRTNAARMKALDDVIAGLIATQSEEST